MSAESAAELEALLAAATSRRTVLSPCRRYRYALWRSWIGGDGYALFVGLNPSTADEAADDRTIVRCMTYAKFWGFEALCMVNLFASRATDPREMKVARDPVGLHNDRFIETLALEAGVVVAAWGCDGAYLERDRTVLALLPRPVHCLKLNGDGSPGHALYLRGDLKPRVWLA